MFYSSTAHQQTLLFHDQSPEEAMVNILHNKKQTNIYFPPNNLIILRNSSLFKHDPTTKQILSSYDEAVFYNSTIQIDCIKKINLDLNIPVQKLEEQKISIYLIRDACKNLISYDSIVLDDLCETFGMTYLLKQKQTPQLYKSNSAFVIKNLQEKYNSIIKNSLIQKQMIENNKAFPKAANQTFNNTIVSTIFNNLQLIYQFLNSSMIGFLRGDIHSQGLFQLHKYIDQKLKQIEKNSKRKAVYFEAEDFKKVLNLVTNSTHYRVPEKGIYNRKAESNANLYKRQVLLQKVSSEQAEDKLKQILESLAKLNKVQEVGVIRKIMIQWMIPLTKAIKEEQTKCRIKDSISSKKIYADFIDKIDAEKIATMALSELMVQIFQVIYKYKGDDEEEQTIYFEGISEKKFIAAISRIFVTQLIYERQERLFKAAQREFDNLLKEQFKTKKLNQAKDKQNSEENKNQSKQLKQLMMEAEKIEETIKYNKSPQFQTLQKKHTYRFITPENRRQFLIDLSQKLSRKMLRRTNFDEIPEKIQHQLGSFIVYLVKQLVHVKNKYNFLTPLLTQEHKIVKKYDKTLVNYYWKINDDFLATILPKLQKNEDMFMHMQRSVPTIIQPLPWIEPEIGGYYSQATNVMRYSMCPVQQRLMTYADNYRAFSVLNYLSSTPWKINKQILKIVEAVWEEGGQTGTIPKRYSQILSAYTAKLKIEKNYEVKKQLTRKIQQLRDEHSLRSDFLLKLNIARSFSKLDYFYFPHNFDFRGRVYPIPPHFNHIGNDLARGLLLFGQGKRLGQSGLKWLKIHCANLMGKDKATISDKILYAESNLELINQIAQNPLKNRIWLTYEDCWQALSSIFELSTALKFKNPQDYVSNLHIHQDGSCNGLQHYAALGRDMQGAYQVNLGPGQKPGDVYTHVAKMVIAKIQQDLQDEKNPNYKLAIKLTDNIKRKTIKQTVMTSVYGVTFIGARQQIYKQLIAQQVMPEDQTYKASIYVAKLTLNAISNLFNGAHRIKKWLINSAKLIARTGNPVGWITPIGLPVVQPYRKQSKLDIIRTVNQTIKVPRQVENIPVNSLKQSSAFPPNYVHSLDSTHMMYTAQYCATKNLTFAAVHDSYWTHAATVDEVNVILRDQFIKLHSQPLLQNLKKSFEARFPEVKFEPIPERGTFDLEKIRESIYFFS